MRRLALIGACLALAGCGRSSDDEREIREVIRKSNAAFLRKDWDATCSYYTAKARREVIESVAPFGGEPLGCDQAWKRMHALLDEAIGARGIRLLTSLGAEKIDVDGERAEVVLEKPPAELARQVGLPELGTFPIDMRRDGDRWLIDSIGGQ